MSRVSSNASVVLLLAVSLAGCATAPRPQVYMAPAPIIHKATKPAPVAAPAPVQAPAVTPNAQVKKRWYDRFKKHPKWFH